MWQLPECLSLLSSLMIKIMTKGNFGGEKGLFGLRIPLRETKSETKGKNLEVETEAKTVEGCLLV